MDNADIIIKQLHDEAVKLLDQKLSDEQIIIELKKMGIDDHYAEIVLLNAKEMKSDTKEFYKHLLGGIFVLVAGIILSIGTYVYSRSGGFYIVFTGIMLYGIFAITRALVIFRK
jgi:hypothetical protein